VPCFLLRADPPEPTPTAPEVKMIVSQPRRIAAKALAERVRSCEPDIADKIGLRMGHGIREHETSKTRAWFVTTGYVVRLLANHPGWFDSHTHLIIDEVHERSIDTDILCLLCRRLLSTHPTIRLVLMSATMAAELYSQYFGSPRPPIHVGVRTFQIQEYFVEDLSNLLSLSSKTAKVAMDVYTECEKVKCLAAPSANGMEKLHFLAAQITASVGGNGSSVLIFVPGMSDIESIIEVRIYVFFPHLLRQLVLTSYYLLSLDQLVEKFDIPGSEFICLPIHSDVPFEEQMAAFVPAKVGEVKVIIATNAAESSLTLPDVDHVICLG
jgi:HrpA-like RNA helicase